MKCRGAPMCAPENTDNEIPGRHTGLPLQKKAIRQKNKKTNKMQGRDDVCARKENKQQPIVGAHRCVRPKKNNSNQRRGAPMCAPEKKTSSKKRKK